MKINILIVSAYNLFEDQVADTYTMSSFMGLIPKENIFQIVCKDDSITKAGRLNDHTFILNHNDILFGKYYKRSSNKEGTIVRVANENKVSFSAKLKSSIYVNAKALYSILPYRTNNELYNFIKESNVDLIYTCSASPREYILISTLSKKLNIPVLPHFFDDWQNVLFDDSFLMKPFRKKINKLIQNIITNNKVCLTICDLMSVGFSKRYGTNNFSSFLHSVPKPNFEYRIQSYRQPINIVYGGSLYLDRDIMIAKLATTIQELELEENITISIYSPQTHWNAMRDSLEIFPFVLYKGSVSQEEMLHIIHNDADILLFPECISDKFLKYIRYSMSTKIPEYLSSGHPIIAIGNEEQGSIQYLKKNDAAYMITKEEDFKPIMQEIIRGDRKTEILDNAYSLFLKNHIREEQEKKFIDVINIVSNR